MDFDRILASAPVNAQTAKQMGRGEHWQPEKDFNEILSDLPLPTKPPKRDLDPAMRPGSRFGQLTVIGLAAGKWKNAGARYVVRCSCGMYTHRRASALKQGKSDRCAQCEYVRHLREDRR